MRTIILASRSKQRQEILKNLGIKFKVVPSSVKEDTSVKTNCAQLVKGNALGKARDVARRLKSGIVLAADTVVLVGKNRIIGKPKSLSDARRTLKILSVRPQWIYTGLAIIDIDNDKTVTGFEKTKVVMEKLSEAEIKKYFSKTSPFDKAGSFDIQGRGGMFIRRIEGCFYNVVGLPAAKLYELFKKIGVSALMLLFALSVAGCATEYNVATGKEEMILYDTPKEISMGQSISRALEKEYPLVEDVTMQERVRLIGEKVARACDRQDITYYFKVVDEKKEKDKKEVNAVSLPGGYVYVFRGLMDIVESDDQLAAVLAHEVGHIVAKHSIKKLQAALGYTFLSILAAQTTSPGFAYGMDVAMASIFSSYSQEDEFLADKLGILYAEKAGYRPDGMITFLEKLKEVDKKERRPISYFRTHPYISERIAKAKQTVRGSMDFSDYLNLGK